MKLHYVDKGQGKTIIFIHGMASSSRYWDYYMEHLSKTNRVIAIDLLGFGQSPKPRGNYDTDTHVTAILDTIHELKIKEPFVLVGHSMGALITLRMAAKNLELISRLVVFGLPVYKNEQEVKESITKSKKLLNWAYYGRSSNLLCTSWCKLLRPVSSRVAPFYLRTLPRQVAEDSVLHTWNSYSESLKNVITKQSVDKDIQALKMPALIIMGKREDKTVLKNIQNLSPLPNNVNLILHEGSHHLPLENPSHSIGWILGDA